MRMGRTSAPSPLETTVPLPSPRPAWWMALPLLLLGCTVRAYQPMSGLHRPVAIDPQLPNFRDTELDVRCIPGGLLRDPDAADLCRKVGRLFENQGARVRTSTRPGSVTDDLPRERRWGEPEPPPSATPDPLEDGARTTLILELRAREVHASSHPLSWILCAASFTLLPGLAETTFAQDLVVRDAAGFPLVVDTLEGRLVRRFGAGPWLGATVLDLFRAEANKLGGTAAAEDLSADLYRQLSQLVFNAKMHAQTFRGTP